MRRTSCTSLFFDTTKGNRKGMALAEPRRSRQRAYRGSCTGKYGPNLTGMIQCKLCFFHSQLGLCPKLRWLNSPQPSSQANNNSCTSAIHETQYPFNEDTIAKQYSMCVFDVALIRTKRMHR